MVNMSNPDLRHNAVEAARKRLDIGDFLVVIPTEFPEGEFREWQREDAEERRQAARERAEVALRPRNDSR